MPARNGTPDGETAATPGWDALAAWACIVVGALVAASVLAHRWPAGWLPPGHADPARAYDLRLFRLMLLLEGTGLMGLGIAARIRAAWFRRWGGVGVLETRHAAALLLLLAAHAAAFAFFLPPQHLLSNEPVHSGAHLAHFYRIFAAHRLLAIGRTWGYDPFFLAGMPAGVAIDLDTRGDTLFAAAAPFLSLALASKAYIVLVDGLLPLVVYAAARAAGVPRGAAVLGAFLAVLHWHWGRPVLGTLRWQGAHSYLLAAELVVVATAWAPRCFDPDHRARAAAFAGLALLGGLLTLVQPAGLLLLVPALSLCFGKEAHRLRGRDWAALALLVAFLTALQGTWLPDYARLHALTTRGDVPVQLRGPANLLGVLTRPTAWLALAILVLGAAGLRGWGRRRPVVAWTLGGSVIAWLAVAALATRLGPLARLECARALVPAVLLATLPAGMALHGLLAALQRRTGPLLVALLLLVAATLPPFLALLETRFYYVHRLHALLAPGFADLTAALDTATPAASRILFESTANTRTALSEGEPLEALLPVHTRRELVGPPLPSLARLATALSFGSGQLGGQPLAAWTRDDLVAFLARYDVGTVVAWSPPARAFLDAHPSLVERAETVHGFAIYCTTAPTERVRGGAARAHLEYDRIQISGAAPDTLVVRAHWLPGLRCEPPVPLAREAVPGDPLGFIRLLPGTNTSLLVRTGR